MPESLSIAAMETTPVDRREAAAIEGAEARAWADLYAAAPAEFAAGAGVSTRVVDGALVLTWTATGRRYFSRAIGLGVVAPATEAGLDDILDGYARAGVSMFLLQSLPHCRPEGFEDLLRARGLEQFDAQDRIVRGDRPLGPLPAAPDGRELVVERVDPRGADEWSEFIQRVYRLETGPWLPALIGRPRWFQYVVREHGEIVGARGTYVGDDGIAWLGMDGPVPGVTTDDHEPDAALCARIVADGLVQGARLFIADIEAPFETMDTPAYDIFGRLGFTRPYVRTHWTRP
jgi:hypothetical protein